MDYNFGRLSKMSSTASGGGGFGGGGSLSALANVARLATEPMPKFVKKKLQDLIVNLYLTIAPEEHIQYSFRIDNNLKKFEIMHKTPDNHTRSLKVTVLKEMNEHGNVIAFGFYNVTMNERHETVYTGYVHTTDEPLYKLAVEIQKVQHSLIQIVEEPYRTNGSFFSPNKERRNTLKQKRRKNRRKTRQN